jgi:RNA polymerase sigma-70 factor (ECF subfamily)
VTDRTSSREVIAEPRAEAPSFRNLFDTEFSYVWNTLRRLGVHESDVLDQAQEVFLIVHSLLPDYDASRPVRPWLFAIAYRIACRYRSLARHKREVHGDTPYEPIDPAIAADEKLEMDEARALMLQAIQGIDLPRRAVFILSELEEQPMADIAAALQIPVNTAYSRLRLAREDFEKAASRLLARRASVKRGT